VLLKPFAIGNAIIKNLDAHINDHLDEVLIGMNTLKYFHMTQSGNTLTLIANNAVPAQAFNQANDGMPSATRISDRPIRKPMTLIKTVTCDEHKVCKTTYSDH
jgi:aspartyl protease family protein